jgi:hypothetical protein
MTLINHAVVVGDFSDRNAARQAVVELRRVGFPEDQIGVRSTAEKVARRSDPYASRTLVTVRAPGRYEEASAILRRYGAVRAPQS